MLITCRDISSIEYERLKEEEAEEMKSVALKLVARGN
jgi:hypothetical protein